MYDLFIENNQKYVHLYINHQTQLQILKKHNSIELIHKHQIDSDTITNFTYINYRRNSLQLHNQKVYGKMKTPTKQILNNYQNSLNNEQYFPFLLTRNSSSKFPRYSSTHGWQEQEIHKAAIFLIQFQNQLKQPNRNLKICLLHSLSQFVFTRNFNQCRLYFQSVMKLGIDNYLQQMSRKYPQLGQQRKQYQILWECIRSNSALQQNSLDIDFSVQTGNNHLKDNLLDELNNQQQKSKLPAHKQQSKDWNEFTEKDYQNNFMQNLHDIQKQSNLKMQLLLAQKYKDTHSESVCNIYRVDPFPYKMSY